MIGVARNRAAISKAQAITRRCPKWTPSNTPQPATTSVMPVTRENASSDVYIVMFNVMLAMDFGYSCAGHGRMCGMSSSKVQDLI